MGGTILCFVKCHGKAKVRDGIFFGTLRALLFYIAINLQVLDVSCLWPYTYD